MKELSLSSISSVLPKSVQYQVNRSGEMATEQMSLRWNKFSETAEKAFRDLGSSGDFSDVTLAGADGNFVEAHRVILSSCSPVLKTILLKISHTHPLLYLKGMNMEDINLLLKFVYTGEVTLEKESLDGFLATANELQIAGLTKPEKLVADEEKSENNSKVDDAVKEFLESDSNCEVQDSAKLESDDQSKVSIEQGIACEYPGCGKEYSNKAHLKRHTQKVHEDGKGVDDSIANPMDTEEKTKQELMDTADDTLGSDESKSNACDRCGIENKSGKALMKHRREEHPGVEGFLCGECGKEFAANSNLHIHKKSIHQHVKFPCDLCDHQSASKSYLSKHMKAKHTA